MTSRGYRIDKNGNLIDNYGRKKFDKSHLTSDGDLPKLFNYNGRRFGVDTGCLAEIDGPQFYNYTEDSPTNWASGFAVLTFHNGKLLYPELVHKFDKDHIEFRGQIIKVR